MVGPKNVKALLSFSKAYIIVFDSRSGHSGNIKLHFNCRSGRFRIDQFEFFQTDFFQKDYGMRHRQPFSFAQREAADLYLRIVCSLS